MKSVNEGGLGIPNVRKQIYALKMTWIRKLLGESRKWNKLLEFNDPKAAVLQKIGCDLPGFNKLNKFWKDVFMAYRAFGHTFKVETAEEFCCEPLFCNPNVKVGNDSIYNRNWLENEREVFQIGHLMANDGSYYTFKNL